MPTGYPQTGTVCVLPVAALDPILPPMPGSSFRSCLLALAAAAATTGCGDITLRDAPEPETPTPEPTLPPDCESGHGATVTGDVGDLGHHPISTTGAEVLEWPCGEEPVYTGRNESFELDLIRADRPIISVLFDDFIPVIVGIAGEDLDNGIEVALYSRLSEYIFRPEDFGAEYDPAYGALLVHLFTGEDSAASAFSGGASAAIDLPYDSAWILDTTDAHDEGHTVPIGSSSAEIWFFLVEPGMATIEVVPPDGAVCTGPSELPVFADTYTHANFLCAAAD